MAVAASADHATVGRDTTTESITRTVVCKLESSRRKNELLREWIDEWQTMLARAGELLPSVSEGRWGDTQQTWVARLAQSEFPTDDIGIKAHHRDEAFRKASEAFGSWKERGCDGEKPSGAWGECEYIRCSHDGVEIVENDRGYGVKLSIEPWNPEWFHASVGSYQAQYLDAIVNGDATAGSFEVRFRGDTPHLHCSTTTDVTVLVPDDASTVVGVDVGENVIVSMAALDGSDVCGVELVDGGEFRHHRDRIDETKQRLQSNGNLNELTGGRVSEQRQRYTDHVTNVVSRRVVDFATEHYPSCLALEELTYYRENAPEPIHDWPYAEIQSKIAYKATSEGVPVVMVDPAYTSQTCRTCGARPVRAGGDGGTVRDGSAFRCTECGYEVHADVNAAMNVAQRASRSLVQ